MAKPPLIDVKIVRNVIRILDWCYRMGVRDARNAQDEGLCYEFLDKTSKAGVYGFLTDDFTIDWIEWSSRLRLQAMRISLNNPMNEYFRLMGNFNVTYLCCLLPLTQHFYGLGVADFCNAPNGCEMAIFEDKTRVFWTEKGCRAIKLMEYKNLLQAILPALKRRDKQVWDDWADKRASLDRYERAKMPHPKHIAIKPKFYDTYSRAMGLAILRAARGNKD